MTIRLFSNGFGVLFNGLRTYGVGHLCGKVVAGLFLFAAPALADPVRVLAFGDSLTQGYGLIASDGLVPQLDAWLDNHGAQDVTIVNAGVSGDTTAGGAARIGWSLTPDIDAMILTLGGNDMLRGLDPAEARRNLDAILREAGTRDLPVLLVGMSAPANFGPDYKRAFDAMYPDLAREHEALYFENFFAGLGAGDPADLQRFFQPDGIHPNATGVQRIVEALGPSVLDLVAEARERQDRQ